MNREYPTPNAVFEDLRVLDDWDPPRTLPARIYSNLPWPADVGGIAVDTLSRPRVPGAVRSVPLLRTLAGFAADAVLALRLWGRSRVRESVGILEADRAVALFGMLRAGMGGRGRVVLLGFYLDPEAGWRRRAIRSAMVHMTWCAVWSREQGDRYARALGDRRGRYLTVPYKANHSRGASRTLPPGDYVFSGGNSQRDYRTLFAAVDGLDIPVVVSSTDPRATRDLVVPPNVDLVEEGEPRYRELMAGARIVVVPLSGGRLRGAGEATFLNAMWHGRPVVCADDVSAPEYVEDGVDGRVVPPGDAGALRAALVSLWEDPARAGAMGRAGRTKVEAGYTHRHYVERVLKLGAWLALGNRPPHAD